VAGLLEQMDDFSTKKNIFRDQARDKMRSAYAVYAAFFGGDTDTRLKTCNQIIGANADDALRDKRITEYENWVARVCCGAGGTKVRNPGQLFSRPQSHNKHHLWFCGLGLLLSLLPVCCLM
jgi:hypothetical protein